MSSLKFGLVVSESVVAGGSLGNQVFPPPDLTGRGNLRPRKVSNLPKVTRQFISDKTSEVLVL